MRRSDGHATASRVRSSAGQTERRLGFQFPKARNTRESAGAPAGARSRQRGSRRRSPQPGWRLRQRALPPRARSTPAIRIRPRRFITRRVRSARQASPRFRGINKGPRVLRAPKAHRARKVLRGRKASRDHRGPKGRKEPRADRAHRVLKEVRALGVPRVGEPATATTTTTSC